MTGKRSRMSLFLILSFVLSVTEAKSLCIPVPECKERGSIPIPCEGYCSQYFKCRSVGAEPKLRTCASSSTGAWFNPETRKCASHLSQDCSWYKRLTTTTAATSILTTPTELTTAQPTLPPENSSESSGEPFSPSSFTSDATPFGTSEPTTGSGEISPSSNGRATVEPYKQPTDGPESTTHVVTTTVPAETTQTSTVTIETVPTPSPPTAAPRTDATPASEPTTGSGEICPSPNDTSTVESNTQSTYVVTSTTFPIETTTKASTVTIETVPTLPPPSSTSDFPHTKSTPSSRAHSTATSWPPQPAPTECTPDLGDIMLPDPTGCGGYVRCYGGRSRTVPCASGTSFDYSRQICDYASASKCDIVSSSSTTTLPTTTTSRTTTWSPQWPPQPAPLTCTKTMGDIMLPDPKDCSKYIRCYAGRTWSMPCAPGTLFSYPKQACDLSWAVECDAKNPA